METEKGYKPYILVSPKTSAEQAGDLIWVSPETDGKFYVGGKNPGFAYRYGFDELIYLFSFDLGNPEEVAVVQMMYPELKGAFPAIESVYHLYRGVKL